MSLLLGVLAAAAVAFVLVYVYPEETEKWLVRLLTAKRFILGTATLILALFLIATGASYLPILGVVILVSIFVYVLIDPENEFGDLNPL